MVLALETTETSAEVLQARLRRNLTIYNARRNRGYELSFSVGVARYDPERPCSIEELLTQADANMYESKWRKRQVHTLSGGSGLTDTC